MLLLSYVDLRGVILKNFKISGSHIPLRFASLRMPAGNRAAFAIKANARFLKFHATTLRGL